MHELMFLLLPMRQLPTHPPTHKQVKLLRSTSALLRQARIEVIWAKGVELDVFPLYERLCRDFLGEEESPVPLKV